jgi:hypothetical protein
LLRNPAQPAFVPNLGDKCQQYFRRSATVPFVDAADGYN